MKTGHLLLKSHILNLKKLKDLLDIMKLASKEGGKYHSDYKSYIATLTFVIDLLSSGDLEALLK